MTLCSCGQAAYKDNLCQKHYAIGIWSSNTNIENLGILLFFKQFCPKAFKNFKYGIPKFHKEILFDVIQDKPDWKFYNRQVVIAAPRGSSKTTLVSKAFALYCALIATKKYIVISSKTGKAAQKNLRWIKIMLSSSKIISFFGDLRPESRGKRLDVDTIEGKWTTDIVVLRNGVTIEAIGMGQQLRSAAEGEESNRIDLFIADDIETDENNKTPDRRESNKVWFFETVLPTLDVDTGTIVFINTMTHSQSILATLLGSRGWRKRFYQITSIDGTGKEVPLWAEKFSPTTIQAIRDNYAATGRLRSFYKEYYNLIRSDEGFSDNWVRYWTGRVFRQNEENWIEYTTPFTPIKSIIPAYLTLGIDMAFSEKERADYSVLFPVAQTYEGNYFLLPYSRGRYSVFDDFENGALIRKGIVSEAVRLHNEFRFDKVIIGSNGGELGTFKQVKVALLNCAFPTSVVPYIASGEKFQRLKDFLQPLYESGKIHHSPGMQELHMELVSFGDTTDDILDALFNAIKYSRKPPFSEYHPIFTNYHNDSLSSRSPEERKRKTNWMVV